MTVRKLAFAAFAIASLGSAPASAQTGRGDDTAASEAEKRPVLEAIAKIGCRADEVEKESDTLFEVDDARREIGRYVVENAAFLHD